MQIYKCITLITLHVINNIFAHNFAPILLDKAVYSELEFCYRLKHSFIYIEYGVRYHTSKTTNP